MHTDLNSILNCGFNLLYSVNMYIYVGSNIVLLNPRIPKGTLICLVYFAHKNKHYILLYIVLHCITLHCTALCHITPKS